MESFNSKDGIRCLLSTSSLAWGVNLNATRVIINGVKRGMEDVEVRVVNMDRTPVDSSYLRSVGYDDEGIMEVEFRDGAVFEYDVPYVTDFWDLMEADSKGQKFYYDFRTSVPYRKVRDSYER